MEEELGQGWVQDQDRGQNAQVGLNILEGWSHIPWLSPSPVQSQPLLTGSSHTGSLARMLPREGLLHGLLSLQNTLPLRSPPTYS